MKNCLSEYLRLVRAGKPILVTDQKKVVAKLRGPLPDAAPADPHPGLAELARQGRLRPGSVNEPDLYPALPRRTAKGTAARLLDEEQGER